MRIATTRKESEAILAAMLGVAATGRGEPGFADRTALAAAARWMFGVDTAAVTAPLPAIDPARLADALSAPALRVEAVRFLTVMAFVDGTIDPAKIARVVEYADALGVHEESIDEIAAAARGSLDWALAHMVRDNMTSVIGRPWPEDGDVGAWLQPYRDTGADPALAARYRALAQLPSGTFGRAFLEHFERNGYAVPGEPDAINERFGTPHDATHVLTGYDTSPRGEILVSTFTAAMHPVHPISGHVLPVIFSWHLGVQMNAVAKSARGALDPGEFWRAWRRGDEARVDTFAPSWDFWAHVATPLDELRSVWQFDDRPDLVPERADDS